MSADAPETAEGAAGCSASALPPVRFLSVESLQLSPAVAAAQPPVISLSPIDWMASRYVSTACLFFYDAAAWKLKDPAGEFMPFERMKSALQMLLDAYPLLAGRVRMTEDGCPEMDMLAAKCGSFEGRLRSGITFSLASANLPLSSLPLSAETYTSTESLPASLEFVPPFDLAAVFTVPALQLQHTRFSCGGVCIGMRLHHWLGDAEAFFQLMEDWTQAYSIGTIQRQPSTDASFVHRLAATALERHGVDAISAFQPEAFFVPMEERPSSSLVKETDASAAPSPAAPSAPVKAVAHMFRFEVDELAAIKAASTPALTVSAVAAESSSGVEWVSTFEALTAHVYHHVWLARFGPGSGRSPPELSTLLMACNFRKRVQGTPPRFFGNGNILATVRVESSEEKDLMGCPSALPWLAARVHSSLQGMDSSKICSTLAWTVAQPNKSRIQVRLGSDDLAVTQWNKQPMYSGSCFEPGHEPLRVCQPNAPQTAFNGLVTLKATPSSTGGAIDVMLGLREDQMERLVASQGFRRFNKAPA
jgi:hypothetical protein